MPTDADPMKTPSVRISDKLPKLFVLQYFSIGRSIWPVTGRPAREHGFPPDGLYRIVGTLKLDKPF